MFIRKIFSKDTLIFFLFLLFILILFALSHKFSLDRYNNYVYGKFDLGNMNQMLYNSSRGNFMELTGYFGRNFKRWSMSHVDPSLLIFVPINLFYTDANFLLFSQSLAFFVSSLLLFFIAKSKGLPTWQASLLGSLVMVLPISGYILVWTTFHPLILAMPFFLGLYLILLKNKKPSKKALFLIYLFSLIFIFSKEELGAILLFLVPYLLFTASKSFKKHIIILGVLGFLWSLFSFLYLIPAYSQERVSGLQDFVEYAQITEEGDIPRFTGENYFLYRYEKLGASYSEIIKNTFLHPVTFFKIVFTKEKILTLKQLFNPIAYSLVFSPLLFLASLPELLVQILASEKNVFSITNHRLLVVIPFMLLSVLDVFLLLKRKFSLKVSNIYILFIFFSSLYFSLAYKNPLIYPPFVKVTQRLSIPNVFAKNSSAKTGEEFENKITAQCPDFLLSKIEEKDKVTVPQPLGAKTSNRYFNALFPAGLQRADVVIADIYARKLMDLLDLDTKYNAKAVNKFIKENKVSLEYACGRFFLLKKLQSSDKSSFGTIVTASSFPENIEGMPLLEESTFFKFKHTYNTNKKELTLNYFYRVGDEKDRSKLFAYTILKGKKSRWQFAHFPSFYYSRGFNKFSVKDIINEQFTLKIPSFVKKGTYDVYFGLGTSRNNDENIKIGKIKIP